MPRPINIAQIRLTNALLRLGLSVSAAAAIAARIAGIAAGGAGAAGDRQLPDADGALLVATYERSA